MLVICLIFGLNLLGLFELLLPSHLNTKLVALTAKEGLPGAFVHGLFTTLLGSACTAPLLGPAIGFALAQPPPVVFSVFAVIATGLALPYFLLEAGAAGLPVIASNVGGIPEIIENEATGILMRSKSSDEIKRAIEYALENREKIARFGDELEEKVAHEFNLHDMVQKTVALYEM